MKRINLFKILLDILFSIYSVWLIPIIFNIPNGKTTINHVNFDMESWDTFSWFIAIISLLCYFFILRGLHFLRKLTEILSDKSFSDIHITNSKNVGYLFLLSGILLFIIIILLWLNRSLSTGIYEIGYDMDLIAPLTLLIIGMFFNIQTKNIILAKNIKQENDLTI